MYARVISSTLFFYLKSLPSSNNSSIFVPYILCSIKQRNMGMILSNAKQSFSQNEVENYLGPSEKRYFGQNYKKINHNICELTVSNNCISGNLSIVWPDCWAEKKGKKLLPHIGTHDFFVIAIRFVELYILNVDDGNLGYINDMWISKITCQSNKCIEKSNITCRCFLSSISQHSGIIVYEYEVLIDCVKVCLAVEIPTQKRSSLLYKTTILKNSFESYFLEGYKRYNIILKNISLSLDDSVVSADIESSIFNSKERYDGLIQSYMPCFTLCDLIIAAGQLSQILLLEKSGTTRDDSYNLWMRQIKCKYISPIQCCAKLNVRILKSKILNVKGIYYNSVDLCFNFNNGDLIAECKSAYQIQ